MASAWRTASSILPHLPPPRWSEAQQTGTEGATPPSEGRGGPATGSRVKELDLVQGGCSRCWWDRHLEKQGPLPGEGAGRLLRGRLRGFAQTPAQPGRCGFRLGRYTRGCRSRSPCQPENEEIKKKSMSVKKKTSRLVHDIYTNVFKQQVVVSPWWCAEPGACEPGSTPRAASWEASSFWRPGSAEWSCAGRVAAEGAPRVCAGGPAWGGAYLLRRAGGGSGRPAKGERWGFSICLHWVNFTETATATKT